MEKEGTGSEQTAATGPFEFFRKYQKLILYTAGLFALVSFSITGALMGFFDYLFRKQVSLGTLEVQGRVVEVTQEDYAVGRQLHNTGGGYPAVVLPALAGEEDGDSHVDLLAMLRRISIELGLEVSSEEVDRAIAQAVQQVAAQGGTVTPTQIALSQGHSSLGAYRALVAEAMRIGNYMRLEALAADTSDAAMVGDLLEQREKIALQFAVLDKAAIQEGLEEEGATDDEFQAWLEGLDDADRFQFQDTNHVALDLAAVIYDQFDREQFTEELAEVTVSDQQLQQIYDRDKETRWRKKEEEDKAPAPAPDPADGPLPAQAGQTPPPDTASTGTGANAATGEGQQTQQAEELEGPPTPTSPYQAFEDVKEKIRTMYEAEEVLRQFWSKVQDARLEHLAEAQKVRDDALGERTTAQTARDAAQEALDADPENAELKEALAAKEAELETWTTALDEAETGMDTARASFDMKGVFEGLVNGRDGFVIRHVPQPVEGVSQPPTNNEGLKDLGDLGEWTDTFAATSMSGNGDLSALIQRTTNGAFHFMVTDFELRPLKPFAEIKEDVTAAYFEAKADEVAEEKGEAFEEALLRLAKEQIAERVAELEAEKATVLEERFTTWKEAKQAEVTEAQATLDGIDPDLRAWQYAKAELDRLEAELAAEEDKRQELQEAIDAETDETIGSEAKEVYGDVLEAAAAEAGFEVRTLEPYSRQLSTTPRFEYRYPDDVKFLFRNSAVAALEEGETTDLLDDATGRAVYLASCTAVEDITLDDLTRRQLLESRFGFGIGFPEIRLSQTYFQSFTLEAVKERFNWRPSEEAEVADSASDQK